MYNTRVCGLLTSYGYQIVAVDKNISGDGPSFQYCNTLMYTESEVNVARSLKLNEILQTQLEFQDLY